MVPNIVWDRGFARKNRLDPQRHLELHYPSQVDYRLLLVGDQGAAELRRGHPFEAPYAVYPAWEYGVQTIPELEQMFAHQELPDGPVPDERGVEGQEHRVVIINPPDLKTRIAKAFISTLRELIFEYPDVIVHYHGTYSFKTFGFGFGAVDIDPVIDARKGRVRLGSGRIIPWEQAPSWIQWVDMLGYSVGDLKIARNRTMFNIRSAQWAAKHFNENLTFKSRGPHEVNPDAIEHQPPTTRNIRRYNKPAQEGDKLACDSCSLANTCKYYRDGGVCAIPDTDGAGLARYFKTRDSGQIIDGLGRLLEKQAQRFQKGLDNEDASEELDPEVTKIGNSVFQNGVKLAKLVNPSLSQPSVQVGIMMGNGNAGQVGPVTPQAMMAAAVAEIEASGVDREDITYQMIVEHITGQQRKAIDAAVVGES